MGKLTDFLPISTPPLPYPSLDFVLIRSTHFYHTLNDELSLFIHIFIKKKYMQLNEILSLVLTKWSVVNISMLTLYLPVQRGCKILFGSLTAISNILLLINAPLAMEFHLKCTKNSALIFYSK